MVLPLENYIVQKTTLIKEALKQLNKLDILILFVVDTNGILVGTITDGDIRRGFISGLLVDDPGSSVMNANFRSSKESTLTSDFFYELKKSNIKIVPILKQNGEIIRLLDISKLHTVLPSTAVIMAGGRGERLKPLTDNCPKPMLLVGDKPILEHVIDRLIEFGIYKIFISVRYLSDQIISYFGDGSNKGIKIEYLKEIEPLGTFGAISLIDHQKFTNDYILLMNSDILTNIDFYDLYNNVIEQNSDLSIVSIPYKVDIPYAIIEEKKGVVKSICEKPTYTYYANGGIYLFKKNLIKNIVKNSYIDAPDFCSSLLAESFKVTKYELLGYWKDIGKNEDYIKANVDIKHIKL